MKRLFLTFGLVIAFFFTSTIQASIYDSATSQTAGIETIETWGCQPSTVISGMPGRYDFNFCYDTVIYAYKNTVNLGNNISIENIRGDFTNNGVGYEVIADFRYKSENSDYIATVDMRILRMYSKLDEHTNTCPSDDYPLYTYSYDDMCYYPLELDNASNCAGDYNSGTLLAADSLSPANVCKTDSDGSICAYEKTTFSDNLPVYSVNLEVNCFDMEEGDEYPEYVDPDITTPQPEQCEAYGSGFACAEDPSNVCDDAGICDDGCGYVNDQFICFRDNDCVGDSCDIPDVNCTTNPTDPSCSDPTDPIDPECTGDDCDPIDPECTGDDCTSSGGGSASFELDYDKLGDLMNDAAETLIDENEISDGSDITDQISESSDLIDSEFNEFIENSLFDDIVAIPNQNIFGDMANMLPNGGACTNLVFKDAVIDICGVSDRLRPLLYFIFAFLTLIYLRDLLSTTIRSGAQ